MAITIVDLVSGLGELIPTQREAVFSLFAAKRRQARKAAGNGEAKAVDPERSGAAKARWAKRRANAKKAEKAAAAAAPASDAA